MRGARATARRAYQHPLVQTAVQHAFSAPSWALVVNRRFWSPADLAATRDLDRVAAAIAAECVALRRSAVVPAIQEADPSQVRLNQDTDWRMLFFRYYGNDVPANLDRAPVLARFLADHPDVPTASLSVLAPGKRIPLHPGPNKGVLRVQLGVDVPPGPDCHLEVGGERRTWAPGQLLVWDDTYLHRVRNDTDRERSVICFDVVRPSARPRWDRSNRRLIAWVGRRDSIRRIVERAEVVATRPETEAVASAAG